MNFSLPRGTTVLIAPIGMPIPDSFDAFSRAIYEQRLAEVERRILAGENRIEIPAGGFVRHREVYVVPAWRREPIKRLRVERARCLRLMA